MTTRRRWNFEGKVAFVTGAANGIGQSTALAFAQEGAKATAQLIEAHGVRALPVECDVSRPQDIQGALAATVDTFGRLDFAFNNAGIEQPLAYVADISDYMFESNIRVNLGGVFYGMQAQSDDRRT